MGKAQKRIGYLVLVMLLCEMSTTTWRVYGTTTAIQVDPPSINSVVGAQIQVNVSITDVVNLTAWQFRLFFNSTVLNCTGAYEGPFLKSANSTFFTCNINNTYNANEGCVLVGCSLLYQTYWVSGDGVLANVTFNALTPGSTALHFANTELADNSEPPNLIPCTTRDGAVQVVVPDHDVAVTGMLSLPGTVVCLGYCLNVTVTVRNLGTNVETFLVGVYANSLNITNLWYVDHLASSGSLNRTFIWNTTGFALGIYVLNAYAFPVPGEGNTANNNFTCSAIIVSKLGDITGGTANLLDFVPDGKVDMKDVGVVARFFNQNVPPAPSNCDLTGSTPGLPDGKVDMRDVAAVARRFGM